jgi:hypothetical protein|tara:strand:+ start:271 stop:396 length:126 start_codon:yes stop_codon:yes gene_type:complete
MLQMSGKHFSDGVHGNYSARPATLPLRMPVDHLYLTAVSTG